MENWIQVQSSTKWGIGVGLVTATALGYVIWRMQVTLNIHQKAEDKFKAYVEAILKDLPERDTMSHTALKRAVKDAIDLLNSTHEFTKAEIKYLTKYLDRLISNIILQYKK